MIEAFLLTIAIELVIFLAALVALWKRMPELKVSIQVPDRFILVSQPMPAALETDKPIELPIPAEILDYIEVESDSWARDARKRRVRSLYNESQSWDYAFRQLQIEDGIS